MFPPETRLVPLCERFFQLHVLSEQPAPYPFPIAANEALDSIPKIDPNTIPVTLKVVGTTCNDNFYSVAVSLEKAAVGACRGVISALEWSFAVTPKGLLMTITRAAVLSLTATNEAVLTKLEKSPVVAGVLHRFRHRNIMRELLESSIIIIDDDLSENSALGSGQLAKLGGKESAEQSKRSSLREEMSIVSQEGDVYNFGKHPLPEQMAVDPPVDIGRGVKNKENAEDFSRTRKQPQLALGTQDDLLSVFQAKKPEPLREKTREERIKEACDEIGFEKFPDYALEFLRSYYKL